MLILVKNYFSNQCHKSFFNAMLLIAADFSWVEKSTSKTETFVSMLI